MINIHNNSEVPVVTVVMAVFNAEQYLQRAIDSVKRQTYSNWKMICVDDGSTDNSREILYTNAEFDDRIDIIVKENGGPASARAVAFEAMNTEYAVILDSDDEYSVDFLQTCVSIVQEKNVDCIMPNVKIEHPDGSLSDWYEDYGWQAGDDIPGERAFRLSLINPSVHGWCFWRSSLLKNNAIGEVANYNRFNEDEFIQRTLFLNSRKVVLADPSAYYIYHFNSESITKAFTYKQIGYLQTCYRLIDLALAKNCNNETRDSTYEYLLRVSINLRVRLIRNKSLLTPCDYREFYKATRKAIIKGIRNRSHLHFGDKDHPLVYKLLVATWYPITSLTCFVKAKKKS